MSFMHSSRIYRLLATLVMGAALTGTALAGDAEIRLTLPKRTKPTPVQGLNQDGVKAIKKGRIREAKKLFYKAYLIDPNDPFTLNNLGYIAELEGEVDRATRFYDLAAQNNSDAIVDKSTSKEVQGQPIAKVAGHADGGPLEVNRMNVLAMSLLDKDRALEAETILQRALARDPNNPFTLNNLGFAMEKQGEMEKALRYYTQAASKHSDERVIVTFYKDWRGRRITSVAERNARKVESLLRHDDTNEAQVARLNLRGVSALNRNDRRTARELFTKAYKLDQSDAFTLNNMGYVAELDGDRETANFFYDKAQQADNAKEIVGVASRKEAEGQQLVTVADHNDLSVSARMDAELVAKRRSKAPPALLDRQGQPVQTKTPESLPQEPKL
jgi:Flp pilus assembly protein TadD